MPHRADLGTVLRFLRQLVGFDTTSHKPNTDLVRYVETVLSDNGVHAAISWNADGSKANLVAHVPGRAPSAAGTVLSGHTDVVPVDGQPWDHDPFDLQVTNDLAIGRGTTDMKGFLACCLSLLCSPDIHDAPRPVTLVLTYDEEVGCLGIREILPQMTGWTETCEGWLVGEPTSLVPVVGHKSKQNYRLSMRSESLHAALAPRAANSISAAASVVEFMSALNVELADAGVRDHRFEVPHSWVNAGTVVGGMKPNIVADRCDVELEIRAVPGASCAEIAARIWEHADEVVLPGMTSLSPASTVVFEQLTDTPGFALDADDRGSFLARVRESCPLDTEPVLVPFGTEAGLIYTATRIPTVVCGPGSIADAHTPNESVSLEQLSGCVRQLEALLLGPL